MGCTTSYVLISLAGVETVSEIRANSGLIHVSPDWVCEVLSPSTAAVDRITKRDLYARSGIGHYWIVDVDAHTLEAFERVDRRWLLLGTDGDDAVARTIVRADRADGGTNIHAESAVRVMRPKNPIHPGEMLLEEFLVPKGMSQRAFASELGWTPVKLNELVTGKRGVTADSALDLAEALGTSAELWMNLQVSWDLQSGRRPEAPPGSCP